MTMTRTWPYGSKRRAWGALDSGTNSWVKMMAAIPIGMLIQKIARQLSEVTSTPPSTGPSARLTPKTAPQMPRARARSRRSVKTLVMIDRATGLSIEPPRACRQRKIASDGTSQARLHSSEPVVNRARPAWKTRRRPSRSPADPETIRKLAMTSVYASTDHCRSLSEACSPLLMDGSATLTMVESMPTISRLMQQMARMSQRRELLVDIYLLYRPNYLAGVTGVTHGSVSGAEPGSRTPADRPAL